MNLNPRKSPRVQSEAASGESNGYSAKTYICKFFVMALNINSEFTLLKSTYRKSFSRVCLWLHGLYSRWNSPGQNAGVSSLSLLQGRGTYLTELNCIRSIVWEGGNKTVLLLSLVSEQVPHSLTHGRAQINTACPLANTLILPQEGPLGIH